MIVYRYYIGNASEQFSRAKKFYMYCIYDFVVLLYLNSEKNKPTFDFSVMCYRLDPSYNIIEK